MAGYLFNLSSTAALHHSEKEGLYATLMNPQWHNTVASTLADYVTAKEGDNVYFFVDRMVYGIGRITLAAGAPVFENYPGATSSRPRLLSDIEEEAITKEPVQKTASGGSISDKVKRWVIAFEGDPAFLPEGVDMDDLLSSNPRAFRNLRVMWKRSFIKIDDEENLAFKAALLRQNREHLATCEKAEQSDSQLKAAAVSKQRDVALDVPGLLLEKRTDAKGLSSEMLLETGLLFQLANHDPETEEVFGSWDYLSHQVPASPMKPVDYMDRLDVFGYRWIEGHAPIIGDYLIAELKKDSSGPSDIMQVMKYVDWVRNEYASGDYSLIRAFLVAKDFDVEGLKASLEDTERKYVAGSRPARSETWSDLSFVTYEVEDDGHIQFSLIDI